MLLEQPSSEQLAHIHMQLNMTPEGIERDVEYLKEWIKQQPHLPDITDERRLRNLLYFCKNSVEKVKRVTDLYYTVRGQVPEFYANRDPLISEVVKSFNNVFAYPLPRLTSDGSRVTLFRIWNPDIALYDPTAIARLALMAGDIRLLEDTCLSDIFVYDLRGYSLSHLASHTFPFVKKFMFVAQKAFPIRQRAMHVIYAPAFADKMLMLFKPFMKEKLAKRIHIHSDGLGDLFEHVPRSVFPEDYGGDLPPLKELHEAWKEKLINYREFFKREEGIFTDESKRPDKPTNVNNLFGMEGSFRSLTVD